jgi:hypothetical protein
VSLHDSVGDERRRDLFAAEPTSIQTLYGLSSGVDAAEFHVDLPLICFSNQTSHGYLVIHLCFPFDLDTFNRTIFSFALALDVLSKFPVPVSIRLPVKS